MLPSKKLKYYSLVFWKLKRTQQEIENEESGGEETRRAVRENCQEAKEAAREDARKRAINRSIVAAEDTNKDIFYAYEQIR